MNMEEWTLVFSAVTLLVTLIGICISAYIACYGFAWARYESLMRERRQQLNEIQLYTPERRKAKAPFLAEATHFLPLKKPVLSRPLSIACFLGKDDDQQKCAEKDKKDMEVCDLVAKMIKYCKDWESAQFCYTYSNGETIGINLENADLEDVNFRDANLYKANLQNSKLWGAIMENIQLEGVSLKKAQLQRANLCPIRYKNYQFRENEIEDTTVHTIFNLADIENEEGEEAEALRQCVEILKSANGLREACLPPYIRQRL